MEANRICKLTVGLQLLVRNSDLDWGIKVLNEWWWSTLVGISRLSHGLDMGNCTSSVSASSMIYGAIERSAVSSCGSDADILLDLQPLAGTLRILQCNRC